MPLFLLGFQKYFTIGLVVACLLLGTAAWGYRSSARYEAAQRQTIETQLKETVASLAALQRSHTAQVEALNRAEAARDYLQHRRQEARERIMQSPDEDLPVSPALRDAINSVR